jgi:hypothetical protein
MQPGAVPRNGCGGHSPLLLGSIHMLDRYLLLRGTHLNRVGIIKRVETLQTANIDLMMSTSFHEKMA